MRQIVSWTEKEHDELLKAENAWNLTRARSSDLSEELELENLELLIGVHSDDSVIAVDRNQLSSVALIVSVQDLDFVILLRLDRRKIVVSDRNSLKIS